MMSCCSPHREDPGVLHDAQQHVLLHNDFAAYSHLAWVAACSMLLSSITAYLATAAAAAAVKLKVCNSVYIQFALHA